MTPTVSWTCDLWYLRHWLQYWQLRTCFHDNLCYLTINCDTGQHSQFLRCLFVYCNFARMSENCHLIFRRSWCHWQWPLNFILSTTSLLAALVLVIFILKSQYLFLPGSLLLPLGIRLKSDLSFQFSNLLNIRRLPAKQEVPGWQPPTLPRQNV